MRKKGKLDNEKVNKISADNEKIIVKNKQEYIKKLINTIVMVTINIFIINYFSYFQIVEIYEK